MKKKLLVLVAVFLCTVTVLCSCGNPSNFDLMFNRNSEYEAMYPTLTNALALDIVGEPVQSNGDLVLFVGEDANENMVYTVYDLTAGAVIWTATNSENTKHMPVISEINEDTYMPEGVFGVLKMTKNENDEDNGLVEISLYDRKGTCFWTFSGTEEALEDLDISEFYMALDLIGIEGQMFRIAEDGTVTKAFDYTPFRSLPYPNAVVGDYYYEFIDSYGSGKSMSSAFFNTYDRVNVYNSKLELVTSVKAPAYAERGIMVQLLNNGNLLVQYLMAEDDYATEYTLINEDGEKYTLVTYYVDVRSNTTNVIEADYIYMYVFARDSKDGFLGGIDIWDMIGLNRSIENIALYAPIENKRLAITEDSGIYDAVSVALSNNGAIERELNGIIDNQSFLATRVSRNRWIVGNTAEQYFLINERGDVIGDITLLMNEGEHGTDYVLFENKLYDWDLNEKLDLDTLKLDYIEFCTNEGVVFWNEDGALLMAMADGNVKTLIAADADGQTLYEIYYNTYYNDSDGLFVVLDESAPDNTKATIYNAAGNAVYTVEHFDDFDISYYAESNNNVLLEIQTFANDTYKTTYVLLFKAAA